MSGWQSDVARLRRTEDARTGALLPIEALRILNDARGQGYVAEWQLNVGTAAGGVLRYTVVVVFRNRKKDGSMGRRRGEIWYSDSHPMPETAIVRAAMKVANTLPEMPI